MEEEEFGKVLNLAEAEEAGRNIALIIRAFRAEMCNEFSTGMTTESVDQLTLDFGKAIITRILLMDALEEIVDESDSTN